MPLPAVHLGEFTGASSYRRIWGKFFNIFSFYFLCVITDCHSYFKDIGSPITDKAMEEQADTERTKTARTSHTQHTEIVRGESSTSTTLGDISLLDRSMYYWAPTI